MFILSNENSYCAKIFGESKFCWKNLECALYKNLCVPVTIDCYGVYTIYAVTVLFRCLLLQNFGMLKRLFWDTRKSLERFKVSSQTEITRGFYIY